VGGGRAHLDWITGLLANGPLTLRLATISNVNYPRTNVIGVRKAANDPTGTTAPIVMVGAHIDTVLGAPGADDDGSGNGVAQEIARVMSQYSFDKEIRFGGWAGEEDGYVGSQAYLASLPAAEKARFVGEWQMDMVGSPWPDARLWALTPDGRSNLVTDSLHASAGRSAITGFNNCKLSRSDHQAFFDVGIPSAAISWINYLTPTTGCTGTREGNIAAEPEYHTPTDTMANIDQGRMQVMLSLVGGAVMHAALNQVDITSAPNAAVTGDCGDGERILGGTDADGKAAVFVPHATCTFSVGDASASVQVSGDQRLALAATSAGGSVPATLSLTLGAPASFGAFTPGVTRTYMASTTANVISTAGDATLSVTDPSAQATGHLVNGAFSLPQPLKAAGSELPAVVKSYTGPVSNDAASIEFSQQVNSTDALRTGTYSKTLTFTLSTTSP
jgi:hypothetical protein